MAFQTWQLQHVLFSVMHKSVHQIKAIDLTTGQVACIKYHMFSHMMTVCYLIGHLMTNGFTSKCLLAGRLG